ncbi:amidotransferase [Fibrobacterales bacterium]|nr:amidotransferase [Fibrobacterales bacterium]
MIAQIFQHLPFEDIYAIEPWLRERGFAICYTKFFNDDKPPASNQYDFLIVLGGSMGVYDEAEFPYLALEKAAISDALAANKPVLGICLGAQLVAHCLGATVRKNPVKEIGWFSVESVPHASNAFEFPSIAQVFHWHGDTFDIPNGAIRLAKSKRCQNQAFQYGHTVLAFQFHLEATRQSVAALAENCKNELNPNAPAIQTAQQMNAVPDFYFSAIHKVLYEALDYLTRTSKNC